MTASTELPDLSRTAAALEAHDRAYEKMLVRLRDPAPFDEEIDLLYEEVDRLAAEVGAAFGLDTADRNDPEACAALIRPGSPSPPPGSELSFVRKMVALWRRR